MCSTTCWRAPMPPSTPPSARAATGWSAPTSEAGPELPASELPAQAHQAEDAAVLAALLLQAGLTVPAPAIAAAPAEVEGGAQALFGQGRPRQQEVGLGGAGDPGAVAGVAAGKPLPAADRSGHLQLAELPLQAQAKLGIAQVQPVGAGGQAEAVGTGFFEGALGVPQQADGSERRQPVPQLQPGFPPQVHAPVALPA